MGTLIFSYRQQIGCHLYLNRGDGSFADDPRLAGRMWRDLSPALLRNIDYDNDGFVDLWVSGKDGMFLFRNDGRLESLLNPIL